MKLEAGRELDTLVATHIFRYTVEERVCRGNPNSSGWEEVQSTCEPTEHDNERRREHNRQTMIQALVNAIAGNESYRMQPCYLNGSIWRVVPLYSTEMTAAWEVVEHTICLDQAFELRLVHTGCLRYSARFESGDGSVTRGCAHGDTTPHAICLAALKAVGVEVEE